MSYLHILAVTVISDCQEDIKQHVETHKDIDEEKQTVEPAFHQSGNPEKYVMVTLNKIQSKLDWTFVRYT